MISDFFYHTKYFMILNYFYHIKYLMISYYFYIVELPYVIKQNGGFIMKKNTIITVALSFAMITLGSMLLHGSMVSVQGNTITKAVKYDLISPESAEEDPQSYVDTEITADTAEKVKETRMPSEGEFIIDFDPNHSSLKKETVDMDMEDALRLVAKRIEKAYSVSLAGNKAILAINQYSSNEIDRKKGARYYIGFIICDSESGYSFEINTVTGELYSLSKYYPDIDKDIIIDSEETLKQIGIINDMFTDSDLEAVQDTYYDLAEAYIVKNLDEGNVVKKYDICPGSFGTNYVDVSPMYVMDLYCEMDNGGIINIQIDQVTKEVVGFRIWK